MPNCAQCGKKAGFFTSRSDFSGNYFCSDECKTKFNKKRQEKKAVEKDMISEGKLKEIRCKCKSCSHIWHYLPKEEKRVEGQMCWSAYGMATCCLPIQLYSKQQAGKWEQELDKFKKCPKCGSSNITKEDVWYDKEK